MVSVESSIRKSQFERRSSRETDMQRTKVVELERELNVCKTKAATLESEMEMAKKEAQGG